jgi:hypothetical protein
MGFWDVVDKFVSPVREKTVSDDAHSRLARRDYEERNRIKRVEYDDEGNQLLHFEVVISIAGHSGIPIPWVGKSQEDVRESFIRWLASEDFVTVDFTNNGSRKKLTFRGSWVAGFEIGDGKVR